MSFLGLHTAHNLSFYSIPAAWAVAMAPHAYAIALYEMERASGTPGFNFAQPGKTRSAIKDGKLSPAQQDKFLRAESANDNNFTGLGFFAGAILAGNYARLPISTLNNFAAVYLLSRAAYNVLYITGAGLPRTMSWLVSSISCMTIYVMAGNKMF